MSSRLNLIDFTIVLKINKFNPTALNLDFLRYSNIISEDWELAKPPIYGKQTVQLQFKNGVSILGQPQRLVFLEKVGNRVIANLLVPEVAYQCIEALPNLDYQGLGLKPRGYVEHGSDKQILQRLLVRGDWQTLGNNPMQPSLRLIYFLEDGKLNVEINNAKSQRKGSEPSSATFFSGSFDYQVTDKSSNEKLTSLQNRLKGWQSTLQFYQDFISNKFLQAKAFDKKRVA